MECVAGELHAEVRGGGWLLQVAQAAVCKSCVERVRLRVATVHARHAMTRQARGWCYVCISNHVWVCHA